MRVVYVCTDPGVPVFGNKGASVHVQAVLRSLLRNGDEVHLLTPRPGGEPEPDLSSVRVHLLPLAHATDAAERERCAQQADVYVAKVLDRLQVSRPMDLVYERYALWGRTATAWAAAHGVPSLLEVNAPLVDEQAEHRVLVDRERAEDVAKRAMSTAHAVVCVSDAVTAWVRRRAADGSRVHTLPNGVDTDRVYPTTRPVAPATGSRFTVGFVGTLKPWHGVETLVDAAAMLVAADSSYRLLVVGDGPLAASVQRRLDRAGVAGHAEMTGPVAPRDVPALLRRMDVAVAPYPPRRDFYFSPLKVYEYLAAGLPVVASRIGNLPDVLDHGDLGVLVEPGDADGIARAVTSLRADPSRRRRLAVAGRQRAVRRHDWSQVVGSALMLAGAGAAATSPRRNAGQGGGP